MSKIFERIVHRQMTEFTVMNNLLDPRQSGYKSGFSTQSALLRVCHDVRRAVDARCVTILVLFDFSKAFDTISHSKLLIKLRKLGFSDEALKWIFSYLTGRSQAVVDDKGGCSDWLETTSGVPQGSVLGPLLFSLFINDIGNFLRYSQHMIFADDTEIYLSCLPSELDSGITRIAHDVEVIAGYARKNGLQLNISKSKMLVMGSRTFVNRIDINTLPPIRVEGKTIPFVNEVRNLGVIMIANLSWRSHVMFISRRVHYSLHKLKFHRNSLSRELRTTFIVSLIFPLIDYCCLVFNDVTNEMNTKLQQLINCRIRFIFDLRRDVHISPYRRSLGWLSVKSRRLYFLGCATFNIIQGKAPSYLLELFERHVSSLRPSRQCVPYTFIAPSCRTSTYQNSFHPAAIHFWHSLPESVVSAPTIGILKTRLHDHLFALEDIEPLP